MTRKHILIFLLMICGFVALSVLRFERSAVASPLVPASTHPASILSGFCHGPIQGSSPTVLLLGLGQTQDFLCDVSPSNAESYEPLPMPSPGTLSYLTVASNPGTTGSAVVQVLVNGVTTSLGCTLSSDGVGKGPICNDGIHHVSVKLNDQVAVEVTNTSGQNQNLVTFVVTLEKQ